MKNTRLALLLALGLPLAVLLVLGASTLVGPVIRLGDLVLNANRAPSTIATGIAEAYCNKAGVVSANARADIHNFIYGVSQQTSLSNLVDFAFFGAGMNVTTGSLQSWQSTGVLWSNNAQIYNPTIYPGGVYLQTKSPGLTNYLYFTNLPPTPNGRTLVWWAAGSMYASGYSGDDHCASALLCSAGGYPQSVIQAAMFNGGSLQGFCYNGSQDLGSTENLYGQSASGDNSLFCGALISGPSSNSICWVKRDYFDGTHPLQNARVAANPTYNLTGWPTVAIFGYNNATPTLEGWPCILRGFAYFSTVLTTNQCLAIDAYVRRVGLLIDGDSKSTFAQVPWPYWWVQSTNNWGLVSLITNAAVSGTASADAVTRWNNGLYAIRTNSTFPRIIYSLRIGHNDWIGAGSATFTGVSNCLYNVSNLWTWARANGDEVMAWTIDKTTVTWSGGAGANSNLLMWYNGNVRAMAPFYDYVADAENFYMFLWGWGTDKPFLNGNWYNGDQIHDIPAAPMLGTNLLMWTCSPNLGWRFPRQ